MGGLESSNRNSRSGNVEMEFKILQDYLLH